MTCKSANAQYSTVTCKSGNTVPVGSFVYKSCYSRRVVCRSLKSWRHFRVRRVPASSFMLIKFVFLIKRKQLCWHSYKSRYCIGTVTSHESLLALSQVKTLYWQSYKLQYSKNCQFSKSWKFRNLAFEGRYGYARGPLGVQNAGITGPLGEHYRSITGPLQVRYRCKMP